MKKNAVFQKVAPFFPQLKMSAEMPAGAENVAETPEPVKVPKIAPKDPTPPKGTPIISGAAVAKVSFPSKIGIQVGVSKGPVMQPAQKKPITAGMAAAAPAVRMAPGAPQQILVQKTQISLAKGVTPSIKKVEEPAKRSTTPNKR